jgi:hypothetical protein
MPEVLERSIRRAVLVAVGNSVFSASRPAPAGGGQARLWNRHDLEGRVELLTAGRVVIAYHEIRRAMSRSPDTLYTTCCSQIWQCV